MAANGKSPLRVKYSMCCRRSEKTRVIYELYYRLVKNKRLVLSLPLLLASLFLASQAFPSAHAQFTGLVCITSSTTATSCPGSPPTIGPVTVGQTFTVGLFVQGSDAMGGWDIYVAADPAFLNPTSAALGTLVASPSLTSICINGSPTTGSCTVNTANGPGVVEATTIESSGGNECGGISPCSGMALTITYQVVGATPSTSLSYPTSPGCSASSVSSPPNVCVLVADSFGTPLSENIHGATVLRPATSFALTVTNSNPSLTTVVNSTVAPLGTLVSDEAILTGGFPSTGVTGTVIYTLFPNGACTTGTGTIVSTVSVGPSNNVPPSATVTPAAAGSYSFNAVYSGDSNNNAVTSACEPFTVVPAPSFTAGKLHWTHHLSLAKSASTQSWTAIVTNPLSSPVEVLVRIVGASTINPSNTFDVTCGVTCVNTASGGVNSTPGLTPVPVDLHTSSTSISFNQPIPSSFANQKFTFTATLYWTTGTVYSASNSKSGAFAVVS